MPLSKQGNKKKFSNCGNGIAENGEKNVVPKSRESKKKVLRSQYFHNKSHVIGYYQFKFEFNTEIIFLIQQ